jgi:hypothetical protein
METQTITTKTFKEVHAEIENEHLFLQKNHDIKNFKAKADFLSKIGFEKSIATKLYSAVAENHNVVNEYAKKYLGQYKFILKPQLERVCEKYNLFVRDTNFFLGDIPEKNIKDIMGFSVFVDDLPITESSKFKLLENYKHLVRGQNDFMGLSRNFRIPIEHFAEMRIGRFIQIAAIKSLFDEQAFAKSQARILNKPELAAKHQVELDPIVLCETKHGYIIITAWGDEANDELVVNQNHN